MHLIFFTILFFGCGPNVPDFDQNAAFKHLLTQCEFGPRNPGSEGYYAISTGHGYYKEIQLTDETVTSLLDANTYESDEVVKSGGFDDGKKWARTLRDLVKKEKVSPSLAALYRVNRASELTPELTVLMYGFARYMQSTPDRISKFSKVMERVDTSRSIPVPFDGQGITTTATTFEVDFSSSWTDLNASGSTYLYMAFK